MRIVESSDGTVKVVELDPAKRYVLIADVDADIDWEHVTLQDGEIILKRPGAELTFVENPEQAVVGSAQP